MYYIIKNDGTSIFEQPYPFDFCIHCLFQLIDSSDPLLQNCRLVQLNFNNVRSSQRLPAVRVSSITVPEVAKLPAFTILFD